MIQLTIAWTCVGVFIATALITLLAMVGVLKLADKRYLDRLVKVLIVEVCTVCIGMFTGQIELPGTVEKRVELNGGQRAIEAITPQIESLNRAIEIREAMVREYMKKVPATQVDPADRALMDKQIRLDPKALRLVRPQ
jgi:hypothetical protein